MIEGKPINKEKYRVYLDERAKLIQSQIEETNKYDKAILTLAAGAFGFSLVFIKEIVPVIRKGTFICLLLSWMSFGLSLLSTLLSFLASQTASRKQIEILEKEYFGGEDTTISKNLAARFTFSLNISSMAAFIFGVIFLIVFVSKNIPH